LVQVTGPGFLILSFLARLPAAMGPLGVITLVAATTGSFAVAGASAAAYGIGSALGGPLVGTLADRHGQRSVGLVAAALNTIALVAVVVAVLADAGPLPVALLAAAAGASTPQVGPLMRVRWAALLGDSGRGRQLPTAFSYEGSADELSYMAGPALVGVLALVGGSWLPLLVAAGLTLLAAVPYALHRTAPPVLRLPKLRAPLAPAIGGRRLAAAQGELATTRTAVEARLRIAPLVSMIVAMLAIGIVFGATQTGVTAFAQQAGAPGAAGVIYAVLGVGSAVAGLATAWLPARIGPLTRHLASSIALAFGGLALLLTPHTLTGVLVAMLIVGVVSAPYLIAVYSLASAATPARSAGMVMTLLASGVGGGVAIGAALAGRLADSYGYLGAFTVPVAAGVLAVLTALLARPALRGAIADHASPAVTPGVTGRVAEPVGAPR
jgi:MFS family permease